MTGADYAMLGFLIAIFVVSGWFALSRRSDSPSTISPFRPLHVPVAMMSRAEIYERNAVECEREGARAPTLALKRKYRGLAQQWREMAVQAKKSAVRVAAKRPIRRRRRGIVRSAAWRRSALSLLKDISIGFRSGEYLGR